jgi:hypothetical protein
LLGIIGIDPYVLFDFCPTIPSGGNLDFDAALLPGRDLIHTGCGCAPLTGLDLEYLEGCVALVSKNEFIDDFGPFHCELGTSARSIPLS